jgi:hypothetical protein
MPGPVLLREGLDAHGGAARALSREDRVRSFLALKRQHDPNGLLQTDLWRRLFQPKES